MAQAPDTPSPTLHQQTVTARKAVKKLRNVTRDADKELAKLEEILGSGGELKRLQIGLEFEDTPRPDQGEGES